MARLAIVLSTAGMTLAAADLSGTWTTVIPARNNEFQDITFKLVQTGEALTGKLYRDTTGVPVLEGKIVDGKVSFRVHSEEQVGNVFIVIKYNFTGTVKDNGIELTREREPDPALTTGNPTSRANQKVTFTLNRLF